MDEKDKTFVFNKENWKDGRRGYNIVGLLLTLSFYGPIIGVLAKSINKREKQQIKDLGITLAVFVFLGAILAFVRYDIFVSSDTSTIPKPVSVVMIALFGLPYIIFDLLISVGNNAIGKQTKESLENMSLEKLGNEYSGGLSRFRGNLGKRDSGFTILNKIPIAKREGILPCNPYKGVCKVRRSVIYMIFYLTAIILVPLFITFSEMSGGDKKFKIQTFMGYTSAFLAATLGLVLIFVLSTIKDAAGSDVFVGSGVEKNIREKKRLIKT